MNSFHHQAVEQLGRGLRAVAHAADGTVEGIEAPGAACPPARTATSRPSARA